MEWTHKEVAEKMDSWVHTQPSKHAIYITVYVPLSAVHSNDDDDNDAGGKRFLTNQ